MLGSVTNLELIKEASAGLFQIGTLSFNPQSRSDEKVLEIAWIVGVLGRVRRGESWCAPCEYAGHGQQARDASRR